MQFTTFVLTAAALVSSITAQDLGGSVGPIQFTNTVFSTVAVGQKFTITYANASGPVTLDILNGPTNSLKVFQQIATGLPSPSGSFDWTPEKSLPKDTYGLYITDGEFHNFGALFQPIGATAEPSSSVASSTGSSSGTSVTSGSVTSTATDSSASKPTSKSGSRTSAGPASKTASQTTPTTSVPGAANSLASPLALVLLALAAVFSFN